jgi:AcrR family transcriptional regulator
MPKIVDKDAKRLELIEAATIVLAREGLARTKMAHVADEAGVGKGTLYEYFASKDELFLAVCHHCVRWPESASPPSPPPAECLRRLILAMVESYERATGMFNILIDYWSVVIRDTDAQGEKFMSHGAHFYDAPLKLLSEVIETGQAAGAFRADADPREIARIIIAGIEGLRLQRAIAPPGFDLDSAIAAFADIMTRDLKVD